MDLRQCYGGQSARAAILRVQLPRCGQQLKRPNGRTATTPPPVARIWVQRGKVMGFVAAPLLLLPRDSTQAAHSPHSAQLDADVGDPQAGKSTASGNTVLQAGFRNQDGCGAACSVIALDPPRRHSFHSASNRNFRPGFFTIIVSNSVAISAMPCWTRDRTSAVVRSSSVVTPASNVRAFSTRP